MAKAVILPSRADLIRSFALAIRPERRLDLLFPAHCATAGKSLGSTVEPKTRGHVSVFTLDILAKIFYKTFEL